MKHQPANIDELISSTQTILNSLRKRRPAEPSGHISVRPLQAGEVNVGIEIEGTRYWPVKERQVIRNNRIEEDGVVIQRKDDKPGVFNYIRNSDYGNLFSKPTKPNGQKQSRPKKLSAKREGQGKVQKGTGLSRPKFKKVKKETGKKVHIIRTLVKKASSRTKSRNKRSR